MDDLLALLMMRAKKFPESDDYDMLGFTKGYLTGDPRATTGVDPNDKRVHFNDTWKLPNHPSFSNESIYAVGPGYPVWEGATSDKDIPSWTLRDYKGDVIEADTPWVRGTTENRKRQIMERGVSLISLLRGN